MLNARNRPMKSILGRFMPLLLGSTVGLVLGCSLILDPSNSDDVVRCTNVSDCEEDETFLGILNSDYRLAARCSSTAASPDGGDISQSSGEQVCAAIYDAEIGCNAANFDLAHAFRMTYDEAVMTDNYTSCSMEEYGTAGCPSDGGNCADGLTEQTRSGQTFCGNPVDSAVDFQTDLIQPANAELENGDSLEGQDVLDHYCRSFFCSDEFVCDRSTFKCVQCDPDKPFGEGGCGEMYVYGAKSTIYQDHACDLSATKGDVSGSIAFGPIPSP